MDDQMSATQGSAPDEYSTPIPQGATAAPADEYSTPLPQGASVGQPQPTQPPSEFNTDKDQNPLTRAAAQLNAMGAGVGEGLLSTLNGGIDLANKVANYTHTTPIPQSVSNLLQSREQELHNDNANNPTLRGIGYGGETLAEFMLGDEALKGLSMADKYTAVAKTMKVLEKSPRLMDALKLGAQQAAKTGARTAVVQGAQTLVRSGGDVGQAAKDAAIGGVTGGVLGGATSTIGSMLEGAGETASRVQGLNDAAGNADTKEEVAQSIKKNIDAAKNQLHSSYESGIQDLNKRLKGAEVSAQDNPLADKAKQLLQEPNPEDHPLVSQAKDAAGDRLDSKVKSLLESLASGELPADEAEEVEPQQASGLLNAQGKPIAAPEALEPQPKLAPPYKVNDLVQLRQTIRTLADSYEYGDVNSRALRSLLGDPMDDTIENLAEQSGDQTAVSDYQALRKNYRDKINLFDNPVIQNLRDGKMDDAAKAFVGVSRTGSSLPSAGKVRYNIDTLRGIIGDDQLKQFGKQVFGTMMNDSIEHGQFNPAKFIDTWNRITTETKGDLFGLDPQGNDINPAPVSTPSPGNPGSLAEAIQLVQQGKVKTFNISQLAKDAQAAANLQHLTRLGVLVPAGAIIGGTHGIAGVGLGSLLGLTVSEGVGGIAKGRELLNYVANHPKVWQAYRIAGDAAGSQTASGLANAARGVGSEASSAAVNAVTGNKPDRRNVYSGAAQALAQ